MEGPYTLEQINADLNARKYKDSDYWAWHQALTTWVPLYAIGGVRAAADTSFLFAKPAAARAAASASPPTPPAADTAFFLASHAPKAAEVLGKSEPTSSAPAASTVLAAQQPHAPINSSALKPAVSAEAKPILNRTQTPISPAIVSVTAAPAGSAKAEGQVPAKPKATQASAADTAKPLPGKPQTTLPPSAFSRRRTSATRHLRTPVTEKSPPGTLTPRAGRRLGNSAKPHQVKKRRALSAPPGIRKLAHS